MPGAREVRGSAPLLLLVGRALPVHLLLRILHVLVQPCRPARPQVEQRLLGAVLGLVRGEGDGTRGGVAWGVGAVGLVELGAVREALKATGVVRKLPDV